MGALIAAMGVFIFVLLGIVIAMYILSALALSTLAKNNGYADKAFFLRGFLSQIRICWGFCAEM